MPRTTTQKIETGTTTQTWTATRVTSAIGVLTLLNFVVAAILAALFTRQ